jgi:hypothetical protein
MPAASHGGISTYSIPNRPQQQRISATAAEQLLQCGVPAAAHSQQAAAVKLVPQSLVAKAARAMRPWLGPDGIDAAAQGPTTGVPTPASGQQQQDPEQQRQQQDPQGVLQDVAASTVQLSQLLLGLLLQHSSIRSNSTEAATPLEAARSHVLPALPAVLHTKDLLSDGPGSSNSSSNKVLLGDSFEAAADKEAAADSNSSSNSSPQQQQQPLVELQRVIRLGNMSSSKSRTRTSSEYGGDSSSSSSRSAVVEVPAEVSAALAGGLVRQQSAAAARTGQLLAVCRGESVGLMDGRLLAAELCGRGVFTKVSITGVSMGGKRPSSCCDHMVV